MSYYHSMIECWNAYYLLDLANNQEDYVYEVNRGWRPSIVRVNMTSPDYGRYTHITQGYAPSIKITKTMVDEMNADSNKWMKFKFNNNTSLNVRFTGQSGINQGNLQICCENLATGVFSGIANKDTFVHYDVIALTPDDYRIFPIMLEYYESTNPNYHMYYCGVVLTTSTGWMQLVRDGGIRGDWDDIFSWCYLFYSNNWDSVPDWFWDDNKQSTNPDYPPEDDDSEGGYGTYVDVNDFIDIPDFPTISALNSGLVKLYVPDSQALTSFSNWLWSSSYEQNIVKNQMSPMENVIAFGFVPLSNTRIGLVPNTIKIGNLDSQIACNTASQEYIEVPCGSVNVPEYFGSFLDYSADYQIYLPFIGYKPLKTDDFTHGWLQVVYHVDILTGNCCAFIMCKVGEETEHVLYSYVGNCFFELPLSGANYMRMKQGQMSAIVHGVTSLAGSAVSFASGNVAGGLQGLAGAIDAKQQYDIAKPDYEHGGGLSGAGLFGIRYPYIVQTRLKASYPTGYKALTGIPSKIYKQLKNLSGYTEIESVVADSLVNCTDEEKTQIVDLLKKGVYL